MTLEKTFKVEYETNYYESVTITHKTASSTILFIAVGTDSKRINKAILNLSELENTIKSSSIGCRDLGDNCQIWALLTHSNMPVICFAITGNLTSRGVYISRKELQDFLEECQKDTKDKPAKPLSLKEILQQDLLSRLRDIVE